MVDANGARRSHADVTGEVADFLAGRGAMSRLGGTNYGTMCERAASFSHTSAVCGACDGFGFRELSAEQLAKRKRAIDEASPIRKAGEELSPRERLREKLSDDSTCRRCRGTGYVEGDPDKPMDSMFTTVWCGRCRGTGTARRGRNRESTSTRDALLAELGIGDGCPRCGGAGYLIPVTVRETGSSRKGKMPKGSTDAGTDTYQAAVSVDAADPGHWIDEAAMLEVGKVARLVDRIRSHAPVSANVLSAYYGADGDRYGPTRWGRAFAVWPLTESGARLAREAAEHSRLGHGFLLTPLQRLANERDRSERAEVPEMRARALLGRADGEARRLIDQAHADLRKAAAL